VEVPEIGPDDVESDVVVSLHCSTNPTSTLNLSVLMNKVSICVYSGIADDISHFFQSANTDTTQGTDWGVVAISDCTQSSSYSISTGLKLFKCVLYHPRVLFVADEEDWHSSAIVVTGYV
jgi:hypothetical protein